MPINKIISPQSLPEGYNQPRPDFIKREIDIVIYQKGYTVIHEKALKCPCKSKESGGQLSSCQNCGGTGWIFINPIETRMIVHSMNLNTQYKEWSELNRGTASITCSDIEKIGFMDRITLSEINTIYSENLFVKEDSEDLLFFTTYPIQSIEYIGLFKGNNVAIERLTKDLDYTYERNIIVLDSKFDAEDDLTLTIRYNHNPQYHVIDIPRHAIATKVDDGGIERSPITLPIHAIGRYAHYVLDLENIIGNRLIDNSYIDHTC